MSSSRPEITEPLSTGLQCGLSSFQITVWAVLCPDYSVHSPPDYSVDCPLSGLQCPRNIRCHAGLLQLCNGARHHVEVITSGPFTFFICFFQFRLYNDMPEFVYTLVDFFRQLLRSFRAHNVVDFRICRLIRCIPRLFLSFLLSLSLFSFPSSLFLLFRFVCYLLLFVIIFLSF